jgi:NAD(P)-dependent dehydrogenase (short-subunit alcohol dehydrogenase family)
MIQTGLQNKVVLITGANHGIGAATAKAFAADDFCEWWAEDVLG